MVTKLSTAVLPTFRDLLRNMPHDAVNPYEQLKERLLQHYAPSRWSMANRLLNFPPQGDQKPSAMMDRMLGYLPPGDSPDTLFQAIFLNCLPDSIREYLSAHDFTDMRQMAAVADRLWAARQTDSATAGLAALSFNNRRRASSPAHSRRSSPARSTHSHFSSPPPPSEDLQTPQRFCFYHRQFSSAARSCRRPCAWVQQPGNGSAAGGR